MVWHLAAKLEDVEDNGVIGVLVAGTDVALCKLNGAVHAVSNICSHEFALLSDGYIEDGCIECPIHQARFDIATGAAKTAPATEPIAVYPVRIEDGKIMIDLPDA